jgi:hypothetical protein
MASVKQIPFTLTSLKMVQCSEKSTIEASITVDGITLTDSPIRSSPNE